MEIKYPIIIIISCILVLGTFLIKKRKEEKYSKGTKKANLSFLNNSSYFKKKKRVYQLVSISLKVICILLIVATSVLTSRVIKVTVTEDTLYNRDIMLCMDVSASVNTLNKDIVNSLKETVEKLSKERFGISVFNITSITLSPLTSDYNYISNVLSMITKSIESGYKDGVYVANYLTQGTAYMEDYDIRQGSSFIGEGLVTCAKHFDKNDDERTKVVILTTDNEVQGKPLITLQEAGDYCKRNNIIVYGIGTKGIDSELRQDFKTAVEKTGGKYFDISMSSAGEIIREINSLQKTAIDSGKKVNRTDLPQVFFIITMVLAVVIFIIDWRMKV